jgi:hypothetical protein
VGRGNHIRSKTPEIELRNMLSGKGMMLGGSGGAGGGDKEFK